MSHIRIDKNKAMYSKLSRTQEILGCSFDELKLYMNKWYEPRLQRGGIRMFRLWNIEKIFNKL